MRGDRIKSLFVSLRCSYTGQRLVSAGMQEGFSFLEQEMERIGEETKMSVNAVAAALGVTERTIQRHLKEMREEGLSDNVVVRGETAVLNEKEVTLIKARIERSGRTDLTHVCELPNVTTELEMMILDSKVSEWKNRKIEELQRQLSGAHEKIALDAPKVEFHDAVTQSTDTLDFAQVAKLLNIPNMGRNKMLLALRERGVLRHDNSPYQQYVDRGYFKLVEVPIKVNGRIEIKPKPVVFQKGVDFIRKELAK